VLTDRVFPSSIDFDSFCNAPTRASEPQPLSSSAAIRPRTSKKLVVFIVFSPLSSSEFMMIAFYDSIQKKEPHEYVALRQGNMWFYGCA
jgi:hypothetical protein